MKFLNCILIVLTLAFTVRASADNKKVAADSRVQVYLTFRELTIPSKTIERMGFDWLSEDYAKNQGDFGSSARGFDSKNALFAKLRQPFPKKSSEVFGNILGVFTPPQVQLVYKALEKEPTAELVWYPSIMLSSKQSGLVQNNERQIAVIPAEGPDQATIDLEIYLSGYKARLRSGDADPAPDTEITISDGQTLVINVGSKLGVQKVVFAMAQLCDSKGMPIGEPDPATATKSSPE